MSTLKCNVIFKTLIWYQLTLFICYAIFLQIRWISDAKDGEEIESN